MGARRSCTATTPSEIYYVTGGEFAFYLGHPDGPVRRIVAREGDVMPLRGRTPHTVRNEGDVDAAPSSSTHPPPSWRGSPGP